MRLTIREAAVLLEATEEKLYDWIESGDLPAYKMAGQYRINRSELLEWATARKMAVAPDLFHEPEEDERIPSVAESLELGGIHHGVPGGSAETALRSVIARLRLDDEGDREMLESVLLARDATAVAPVGEGIAIPHVRNPVALATDEPSLMLSFLDEPVDFGAPDGQPIFALFFLISPTTRVHLQMLAKIAYLLGQPSFRQAVRERAPAERLIEIARELEEAREPR
jgi:PTS system nitrogen regulatory IIA component